MGDCLPQTTRQCLRCHWGAIQHAGFPGTHVDVMSHTKHALQSTRPQTIHGLFEGCELLETFPSAQDNCTWVFGSCLSSPVPTGSGSRDINVSSSPVAISTRIRRFALHSHNSGLCVSTSNTLSDHHGRCRRKQDWRCV